MTQTTETAVFGGGCFWCTEAVFQRLKGVTAVMPGYAGGRTEDPTYQQVCGGNTGHAEVIRIEFDPAETSYRDLLFVFFGTHDPTTLNRQGNDAGTQYRSVIFYTNEDQKRVAEEIIKDLNESGPFERPVVTEVQPLDTFYEAEEYHREYYSNNPNQPYCQIIIDPKMEKLQKHFADRLK
jgi:peptide-methionine (S)-S-oxide reductase